MFLHNAYAINGLVMYEWNIPFISYAYTCKLNNWWSFHRHAIPKGKKIY
jgi:hypothetical protein